MAAKFEDVWVIEGRDSLYALKAPHAMSQLLKLLEEMARELGAWTLHAGDKINGTH